MLAVAGPTQADKRTNIVMLMTDISLMSMAGD
jgi:hypothetical protein